MTNVYYKLIHIPTNRTLYTFPHWTTEDDCYATVSMEPSWDRTQVITQLPISECKIVAILDWDYIVGCVQKRDQV